MLFRSFTINSPTTILIPAPAGTAGVVDDITVTAPGGTSATSSADQYTYEGPPTVTAVTPAGGLPSGGNLVSISGTNFTGATTVSFGGTQETSFTVNSPTLILIPAPAGISGVVDDVVVTTPSGTSAFTSADHYTYAGTPTVTGISPAAGPLTGGETLTITGKIGRASCRERV